MQYMPVARPRSDRKALASELEERRGVALAAVESVLWTELVGATRNTGLLPDLGDCVRERVLGLPKSLIAVL